MTRINKIAQAILGRCMLSVYLFSETTVRIELLKTVNK